VFGADCGVTSQTIQLIKLSFRVSGAMPVSRGAEEKAQRFGENVNQVGASDHTAGEGGRRWVRSGEYCPWASAWEESSRRRPA
jgi:hypothetical protein